MPDALLRATLLWVASLLPLTALAKVEVQAVSHKNGPILAARISEDIAPGDYNQLLQGLRQHGGGHYVRRLVLLNSIGGSLDEALRMGRLLRASGFETLVPGQGVCQGTCIYLLAAGHKKTVRGAVGLHRPYFSRGDSALARQQAGSPELNPAAYLQEMEIPLQLMDDMAQLAPQNMRLLSARELTRYRLN